jgi:uncharacterized protein YqjF (DUF2071 family)
MQHKETYGERRSPILAAFQNNPKNPVLFLSITEGNSVISILPVLLNNYRCRWLIKSPIAKTENEIWQSWRGV